MDSDFARKRSRGGSHYHYQPAYVGLESATPPPPPGDRKEQWPKVP